MKVHLMMASEAYCLGTSILTKSSHFAIYFCNSIKPTIVFIKYTSSFVFWIIFKVGRYLYNLLYAGLAMYSKTFSASKFLQVLQILTVVKRIFNTILAQLINFSHCNFYKIDSSVWNNKDLLFLILIYSTIKNLTI